MDEEVTALTEHDHEQPHEPHHPPESPEPPAPSPPPAQEPAEQPGWGGDYDALEGDKDVPLPPGR
jgi:hypothetical protein